MRHFKFFSILFSVIFAGLTTSKSSGQCDPAFNQGASVTVNYCATGGTCTATTVSISWNTTDCYGLPDPDWTLVSDGFNGSANGLEFVGSPSCSTSGSTRTCTYSVRAKTNNFMKGRVTATFQGLCGLGAEIVRSIDVFKTFSATDLDNRTSVLEPGQASFYIAGPGCVTAGERVAYAVRDYVTNPPSDGIGQDFYYWTYNSVSGGGVFQTLIPASGVISPTGNNALIVKAPTPMPAQIQVVIRLGQSNSGTHAARFINRKPIEPYGLTAITTGISVGPKDQGGTMQIGGVCMSLNATNSTAGTVTIKIPDARFETGQTYRFTSPSGFSPSVVEGAQQSALFTVNNATPGAGTFTVSAVSTTCGTSTAFYNINRILNDTVNSVAISPTPTNLCLTPGSDYVFTLQNAPTGHTYTWKVNGGTPAAAGWTVISPSSVGNAITLRPPAGGAQAVVTVSPVLLNPPATACNSTISTPTLTIRGDNGLEPFLTKTGDRTFSAQVESGGSDLNFPGGCDASQFTYEWRFRGNYNSVDFPSAANPTCSTWYLPPASVNSSGPFTSTLSNTLTSQSVILRVGSYAAHGSTTCSTETAARLQVIISTSNATPCSTAIGGCYTGTSLLFDIPSVLSRPGGGGDDPQTFSIQDLKELNRMEIVPNPAFKEVEIRLTQVSGNGAVRLVNQQGKVVKELDHANKNQKIKLSGLPAGLYTVEFSDDQDTIFGKLIIE